MYNPQESEAFINQVTEQAEKLAGIVNGSLEAAIEQAYQRGRPMALLALPQILGNDEVLGDPQVIRVINAHPKLIAREYERELDASNKQLPDLNVGFLVEVRRVLEAKIQIEATAKQITAAIRASRNPDWHREPDRGHVFAEIFWLGQLMGVFHADREFRKMLHYFAGKGAGLNTFYGQEDLFTPQMVLDRSCAAYRDLADCLSLLK